VIDTQRTVVTRKQKLAGRLPAQMTSAELNDLFAECLPRLRKVARRMFRNEQDSEDALQEALLLAFRKIDQFEGRSSFSTWVHTIVLNTSKAYYRKAMAHPTVSTDATNEGGEEMNDHHALVDERPTPEQNYLQQERSEIFQRAAEQLPENHHAAVQLFYMLGLGEKATAEALGITISALKAQLHRSRILLSYRIRKSCMTEAKHDLTRARPLMRHRRARCRMGSGIVQLRVARMN
jgi:RNA polymerase sigma-70 factor, ECF subfamily